MKKVLAGLLILVSAIFIAIAFRTHSDSSLPTYPQLSALARNNTLVPFSTYNAIQTDKPVVLCFFCDCNNCRDTARRLASLTHPHNPNVIGIFSIGPEDAKVFVKETGFPGTPLLDTTSSVAQHYGVTLCPRVFVLRGSKVLYSNLDDGNKLSQEDWRHLSHDLHR